MKTEIRVTSVVVNGIGGPEAATLDLIYSHLLRKYNLEFYAFIGINQIGDDLEEFIVKKGKKLYVNIKLESPSQFLTMSAYEKNKFRLDVVHECLNRIADFDKKFQKSTLEQIKSEILENYFKFQILLKDFRFNINPDLVAKLVVIPLFTHFEYRYIVEKSDQIVCDMLIYSGRRSIHYSRYFFSTSILKRDILKLRGTETEVEFLINIRDCSIQIINLSPYSHPPLFTMNRSDITEEQRQQAYEDWSHSLPPSHAAIIRQPDN